MIPSPSFLVVRFSAIGDCVMTAWAATAIRNRYPNSEIAWAVDARCAAVIDDSKLINELHQMPRDLWKANRWSSATWREQMLSFARLRQRRFDFGIDFQGHSKTAICLRLANPRIRLAARATDPLARRLNPTLTEPQGVHIIDWNHQALQNFGDFAMPEEPLMPPVTQAAEPNKVTLTVGAGNSRKQYPRQGWQQVSTALQKQGLKVVTLGGPGEEALGDDSVDMVGKLSLRETMEQVATSTLHLAADTGTGHMAAAYRVPVVSVFSYMDPAKYRPYSSTAVVLRKSDNPADVTPDQIIAAALTLLENQKPECAKSP